MKLPTPWHHNNLTYRALSLLGAEFLSDITCRSLVIAREILCIASKMNKIELIKKEWSIVPILHCHLYYEYLKRYKTKEPLSRLEGKKSFYGFDFEISSHTLDPRPETELLIDLLLENFPDTNSNLTILDIGTGSGCLAITAARFYPHAHIIALDICENAIIMARRNAENAGVHKRIDFLVTQNNPHALSVGSCDVILCNPPYIPSSAKAYLDQSVVDFDPEIALFYGSDGLGFYDILAQYGINNLKKHGGIFVEFGIGQAKCVKRIFSNYNLKSFSGRMDCNDIIRAAHVGF